MRAVEKYLKKFPDRLINEVPNPNLGIVVTIPAFNEAETIKSIDALLSCILPKCSVEIIVNINYSEQASPSEKEFNQKAFDLLQQYAKQKSTEKLKIHILFFPMQKAKVAGVGWARKQVMDEAFRRLLSVGNEDGIITGFDADSDCSENYFVEIEHFFKTKPIATGCSICFEHPISGKKYSKEIYNAIVLYELHLRYFINAQKSIQLPFAYQTVGSSFAVRVKNYAQVNGMSPKKAGEDFYFLHKIIALGNFHNLNTCCVYPSPRISNRVGFGTGPSVGEISVSGSKLSYNYRSFEELNKLYNALPQLYRREINIADIKLTPVFFNYLMQQKINSILENLIKHNKEYGKFKTAFMQWFGGFQILKVLNLLRATDGFKDVDIVDATNQLKIVPYSHSAKELLLELRKLDQKS